MILVNPLLWTATLFLGIGYLAYSRRSLLHWATVLAVLDVLGFYGLALTHGVAIGIWVIVIVLLGLSIKPLRRRLLSAPFLTTYRRMLPTMSDTEREALEAGTVWWDGELFSGQPQWNQLLKAKAPALTAEEQAFIDGPCEELCRLSDDWDITHQRGDLPPNVWQYLKDAGFFAMIIPKDYGGLGFSAYAHSCVLAKVASRSGTVSSTIAVPNSLGPAELLLHYGTNEQKTYYLPRLASGEEIPCFALTGPRAGSDASSLPDTGVICRGTYAGNDVIGIRLNFDKRYITLAPIATVIGLTFRLYDPEKLMGEKVDVGITCALIPRNTPGVSIGRRHFPLNIPFQNGPIHGVDVFVPLSFIIGGPAMAGQGWKMLVEQLSVGRCISLPSNATGGAKAALFATGAYARIRRQFNAPVGRFEGIAEVVARMAGYTYIMDAARCVTAGAIDGGERPSVPSAMLKYHVTELGRCVANDAMDVQGGKGICIGPRNYLARAYQAVPVTITVEGANILTRNLIIFGQGAVRCHPYVLREMNAAKNPNAQQGLVEFDAALFGHMGFTVSNGIRSLVMALSLARFSAVPTHSPTRRFYQHVTRFSASFAFATDVAMLSLGGYLKKKESLSARLGDVLSYMYLASMVLKHHNDQGSPKEDIPLVEWCCRILLYRAQEQLHLFLRNFPNRTLAWLMRALIFPRGLTYSAPSDQLTAEIAEKMINDTPTRARVCGGIYTTLENGNPLGLLHEALTLCVSAEIIERKLRTDGIKTGRVTALDLPSQVAQAESLGILSACEAAQLLAYDQKVMDIVRVDDFHTSELGTKPQSSVLH